VQLACSCCACARDSPCTPCSEHATQAIPDKTHLCFQTGEVYCELPPGSNWNFDVQWAPGQVRGGSACCSGLWLGALHLHVQWAPGQVHS